METNTNSPVVSSATPAPTEAPKTSAVDALFADKKSASKLNSDKLQPPPSDATPPAPKEVSLKQDSVAKQMALIARETKRLTSEKESMLADRERIKSLEDKAKAIEEFEELVKTNPLAALKSRGLDYNELIKAELQRQSEEADPTLRKVRELEHKLSEKERIEAENQVRFAEAQQQRYIDEHVSNIRAHIASNSEKYEFLSTYKAEKDVFSKIKEVFDASVKRDAQGRIKEFKELTIEEACDLVEGEFEDSASALTKLKKIQNKFAKQSESFASVSRSETKEKPKSATLTNALTSASEKPRALTRAERAERAFAALHGQH